MKNLMGQSLSAFAVTVIQIFLQTNTTPLHLAAINGHENLALLLIRSGASLTLKNSAGHNALVIAIMNGKRDVVEAIIDSDHWQVSTSFLNTEDG